MRELLRADLALFFGAHRGAVGLSAVIRGIATNFGLQALMVYRLGRWVDGRGRLARAASDLLLALPRWWVSRAYGIVIETSADIGPGLYIGHFGGIRVGECRIGDHCSIGQSVRIGPSPQGGRGPTIGDRVWIGAHARILGPYMVGDGATVAAGSFHDSSSR